MIGSNIATFVGDALTILVLLAFLVVGLVAAARADRRDDERLAREVWRSDRLRDRR